MKKCANMNMVALAALFSAVSMAWGAGTVVVYDTFLAEGQPRGALARNTFVAANSPVPLTLQAYGDRVTLAGNSGQRVLSSFDFLMTTRDGSDPGASLVDFEINFYALGDDGLPAGSPFFTSPVFTRELFVGRFDGNPEDQTIRYDMTAHQLTVPDTFVPSVRILERRDSPDQPGDGLTTSVQFYTITAAGAVGIGTTPTNYLRQDFDNNWLVIQSSTTPRSAVFRITAINPVPEFVMGDFNFDGGVDGSDVDAFALALSDLEAYLAGFAAAFGELYPGQTLTASVVEMIGDFNGDGGFDGSDVDGFVAGLSASRPGVAAIPEPGVLGVLGVGGLMLSRWRRSV